MRLRLIVCALLGAFVFFFSILSNTGCTPDQLQKANGALTATTQAVSDPVVQAGVPAIATAVGGPSGGALAASVLGLLTVISTLALGVVNHYQHQTTQAVVSTLIGKVADVASASDTTSKPSPNSLLANKTP